MDCKHKSVRCSSPWNGMWRCICKTCGEWLPLGPATITPDVEIEIRAAELAVGDFNGDPPNEYWFDWQAGYLAAAILDEEG